VRAGPVSRIARGNSFGFRKRRGSSKPDVLPEQGWVFGLGGHGTAGKFERLFSLASDEGDLGAGVEEVGDIWESCEGAVDVLRGLVEAAAGSGCDPCGFVEGSGGIRELADRCAELIPEAIEARGGQIIQSGHAEGGKE